MDFQNGDKGERRIIRKTTVLSPFNSSAHSNLRCVDTKQYSKRKTTLLSSDLVTPKLRRLKNTVNIKCLKLTNSDFKIDLPGHITKNKKNKNIPKYQTNASKDVIIKTDSPNKMICNTLNITTFGDDNVLDLKTYTEEENKTNNVAQTIPKSNDNHYNSVGLQEMKSNIEMDANCTSDKAAKKSAETLSYMKKQRLVRKQDLKNEFVMKAKIKERRKQCLENLQVISKKLLRNNIEKKSRKQLPIVNNDFSESDKITYLLHSPIKLTHASFEQQFNNQASEIISLGNIETNFDTATHVDTALPDDINMKLADDHQKENLNSNKKRIKLDKNIIHTEPPSLYNNCHSEKKKKTDTNCFSDLNSSCLSNNYPYNLITAVENKLSVTLKSLNRLENEPCLANTSNSTTMNLLTGINESRNIENQFINQLGPFYGMPNIPGMCSSPKSNISNYNLTESLKKNKSWSKSVDSKKNSFYGVKKY